jgi:hypothetical protein
MYLDSSLSTGTQLISWATFPARVVRSEAKLAYFCLCSLEKLTWYCFPNIWGEFLIWIIDILVLLNLWARESGRYIRTGRIELPLRL